MEQQQKKKLNQNSSSSCWETEVRDVGNLSSGKGRRMNPEDSPRKHEREQSQQPFRTGNTILRENWQSGTDRNMDD